MNRYVIFLTLICAIVLSLCGSVAAADMNTTQLPSNRYIFFNVSNDDGVLFDMDGARYGGPNGTYYIKADGGGLNELHITNTNETSGAYGQVTVINSDKSNPSGVFYFTNTGGRGFDNDIILLVALKGPIPDNFSLHIKSSGYYWTPATPGRYNPAPPTDYQYVQGIDETFTKADFLYGPHTAKPGPGTLGVWSLPLYYGQDINDPSTAMYLMFIDLYAGNIKSSVFPDLKDNGAVKVEYAFTGLTNTVAFNGYGWCSAANQDQGINWSNRVEGTSASGYSINYTPVTPVADFVADVVTGAGSLTVHFTDTSLNDPTSWAWDFNNDGIIDSTQQNPTYTFNTLGTYTVKLIASNLAGSSEMLKIDYITVNAIPTAPITNLRNGKGYNSIQEAVDDVTTIAGDTITVLSGNYTENVVLSKQLILKAIGSVTVTPLDVNNPVFTILLSAAGSVIDGFVIKGATNSHGISINGFSTITNCTITENGLDGINIQAGNPRIISNSIIGNGRDGIAFYTGSGEVNFNRILDNVRYGLYMVSGGATVVKAINNWWGTNNPTYVINNDNPPANGTTIYDRHNGQMHVTYNPWIVLTMNVPKKVLKPGTNIIITADLTHDNNGNLVTGGAVPDGAAIIFNYVLGTLIPSNTQLTNNTVNVQLTAGNTSGKANLNVIIDGYTLLTEIIIDGSVPTAVSSPPGGTFNNPQNVTLTGHDSYSSVTVYYTTDGSDPRTSNTRKVYNVPISISDTTTLLFAALDQAGNYSLIYSETYTILDTLAPTVTANPKGGLYNKTQKVGLKAVDNMDPEPKIYYTTDGTNPTTNSTPYTAPISLLGSTILKFIAVDASGNISGIRVENYVIDLKAPTVSANPVAGSYNTSKTVTLTVYDPNSTAKIYYTIDGSDPWTSSTKKVYTKPIQINNSTTLKYVAFDPAGNISKIYFQKYIIDRIAPTASADPKGGSYNNSKWVTLKMNETGTIYYTLNGTTPTTKSAIYKSPIAIAINKVLRYFAADTAGNKSPVYTQIYKVKDVVSPKASASLTGGYYNTTKTVVLKMNEPGTIYYTLNGNNPTTSSTKYAKELVISSSKTLKFFARDQAGNKSPIYTQKYVIDKAAPKVSSTTPANLATGFSRTADIIVKFNEKIKTSTNFSKITLKNLTTGSNTSITKSISGYLLYIRTKDARASDTWYQLIIPAGAVSDLAGNKLGSDYSSKFKTADKTPPNIIATSPGNLATKVLVNAQITVKFSEKIAAGANYSKIYVKNLTTGKLVTITRAISNNILTIKSNLNWVKNNKYMVYIPLDAVRDASGNKLDITYSFQFIC